VDDAVKVARQGATAVVPPAPPFAATDGAAGTAAPVAPLPIFTGPAAPAEAVARPALPPRLTLEPLAAAAAPVPTPQPPLPQVEAKPVPSAAPGPRFTWVQNGPQVLQLRLDAEGTDAGTTAMAAAPAAPATPAAPSVATAAPAAAAAITPRVAATPASPVVPATGAPATVTAALATLPGPALKLALEISNGAGRSGLARGTADRLQTAGVKAPRVTNHAHYNQRTTVVQYRDASHEAAARALAAMLPWKVEVVANPRLGWRTEVRLLLGRDAAEAVAGATEVTRPA
jgi:hypothetical protein